jgi:hypothetical protein
MKRKMMSALGVMALMLALTAPSPAFERHPEIRAAMEALRNAKQHLEHASHDFGGHRVDAIRAIEEAHHQLEACLEFDRD